MHRRSLPRPALGALVRAVTLAAVLVVGLLPSLEPAAASVTAQGSPFTISVDDLTLDDPQGEGTVLVRLVPDDGVAALTVDVTADSGLVQVVSVQVPGDAGLCAFSDGVVRFAGFNVDPDGWNEPVDLCEITYRGLGTTGTGGFTIEVRNAVSTQLSNGLPIEIEGTLDPGTIRVGAVRPAATPTPAGPPATIDPAPTSTPVPRPSTTPMPTATPSPTVSPSGASTPSPTAEPAYSEATAPATPTPDPEVSEDPAGERGLRVVPPPTATGTPDRASDEPASPESAAPGSDPSASGSDESAGADAGPDDSAADGDPSTVRIATTPDDDFPVGLFGAIAAGLFAAGVGLTVAGRRYPPG